MIIFQPESQQNITTKYVFIFYNRILNEEELKITKKILESKEIFLPFWNLKNINFLWNINKPLEKRSYEDLFVFREEKFEFSIDSENSEENYLLWTDLDLGKDYLSPTTEIILNGEKISIPKESKKKIHIFQMIPIEQKLQKVNQIYIKIPEHLNGNLFILEMSSNSIQDIVNIHIQKSMVKTSIEKVSNIFSSLNIPENLPFELKILGEKEKPVRKETISLLDVFTFKRMKFCVKGKNCEHRQSFDLESFLSHVQSSYHQNCPICSKYVDINEFYIDHTLNKILNELKDFNIKKIILTKEGYDVLPEKQEKKRVIQEVIEILD